MRSPLPAQLQLSPFGNRFEIEEKNVARFVVTSSAVSV
jgi:hypothetical protein